MRRRRTPTPERDPELTLSNRTGLDDARLIKIIDRPVLELVTRKHEDNVAKRDNRSILPGLMNTRCHKACS